jgi:2-methylcitrate dehydratase PrpD
VRALAERVHVRYDPALDAAYPARWPHRIIVSMETGERVLLESDRPPAADRAQIRAKFRALAAPIFGSANADAVIGVVDDLERLPDVQPLLRLLRRGLAEAA